jgi:hypothetical protein
MIAAMSEPLLGAFLSGWSAYAVDVILKRYAKDYAPVMTPKQQQEFAATQKAIHRAALHWHAATANAQTATAEIPALSGNEVTTAEAADLLAVTEQRVRQLAALWVHEGLARKVGRVWMIDQAAIELYRSNGRRAA